MPTFNTNRLKRMVSLAIRGAGCNKLHDLSNMMGIRVEDGFLYLNTTDDEGNFLSVYESCSADNMDIAVDAELFSKLINKVTSETLDMSVVDNSLVVKANGKYTLEIKPDDTGKPLSFPDKFPKIVKEIGKLQASDLVTIDTSIKASLDTVAGSIYLNYYFGDVTASTDKAMASVFDLKVFDKPYLISRQFIELVAMAGTNAVVSCSDTMLLAEEETEDGFNISVCSPIQTNVADYNIKGINNFAGLETKSFCRVRKADLLDLLDRLSLFVNKFDEGAIQLNFTKSYVEVSSIANNSVENIDYIESKDTVDMSVKINIERLRTQLKSYSSDVVDLYYGSPMCIKLVDGKLSQIIALMQ